MKKRIMVFVLTFGSLFFCILNMAIPAPATQFKIPIMVLDQESWNAGEVIEGKEIRHTFAVKNNGTTELKIRGIKPG